MTDEEFEAFKDNVLSHPDLNNEVWLYQGKILDGRHAYRPARTGPPDRISQLAR